MGAGLDLQTHGVAFAAIVKLDADGLKQRARFFFLEVEVGVARDAEAGVGENLVAAVHAGQVLGDEVLEEQVVVFAFLGGQADKAGQGAGHGDHAKHLGAGAAALGAEQQRQAEGLVENAGKGMGGVDGDGGQERIDLALEVVFGKGAGVGTEFVPVQQANALLAQLGEKMLVPALVLGGDEGMNLGG